GVLTGATELAPATGRSLLEHLRGWYDSLPGATRAERAVSLVPILGLFRELGVESGVLADWISKVVGAKLLADCPSPAPGVWQTREEHRVYFEELAGLLR